MSFLLMKVLRFPSAPFFANVDFILSEYIRMIFLQQKSLFARLRLLFPTFRFFRD